MASREPDAGEAEAKRPKLYFWGLSGDCKTLEDTNWQCTFLKRCPLVRYLPARDHLSNHRVRFFHGCEETDEVFSEDFDFVMESSDESLAFFVESLAQYTAEAGITKFVLNDICTNPTWDKVLQYAKERTITIPGVSIDLGTCVVRYAEVDVKKFEAVPINVVNRFLSALTQDFTSGIGKRFLDTMVAELLKIVPGKKKLDLARVEVHDPLTTKFERCNTEGQFFHPYPPIRSPSRGPSPSTGRSGSDNYELRESSPYTHLGNARKEGQKKVPDVQVMLEGWPGGFPILIECKKSLDSLDKAYHQNSEQMLTKFFLQDIIFGLIISPLGFTVQALLKDKKNDSAGPVRRKIYLRRSVRISLFPGIIGRDDRELSIESLKQLFSFIYSVLDWSSQTQCRFHTDDS